MPLVLRLSMSNTTHEKMHRVQREREGKGEGERDKQTERERERIREGERKRTRERSAVGDSQTRALEAGAVGTE